MTTSDPTGTVSGWDERLRLVDCAQKAAGIIAARHQRDAQGASALMADLDPESLAGGPLLLSELALGLYANATHQHLPDRVTGLCLQLENAVRFAGPSPSG